MSEEFTEENLTSEMMDEEREGWKWFRNIFNRARSTVSSGFGSVNNYVNQAKIQLAQIRNLENLIRSLRNTIEEKTKDIAFLNKERIRLQNKNNSLLDNLQYYRTLTLGNSEVDGLQDVVVKQQIKNEELLKQEIAEPLNKTEKKEGLENLINEDYILKNKSGKILEGLNADSSVYSVVYNQNQAIKNQIEQNTNIYSVNNQLTSDLLAKRDTLKWVNKILIYIFLIVFAYACFKVYKMPNIGLSDKIVICILMLLTVFLIHLIEYVLFYAIPFLFTFLAGTPYRPPQFTVKPGIYDYFTSP